MTRSEARRLARGHVARCIQSALGEGWPDAAEFGYTDEQASLVADEIHRIAVRIGGAQICPGSGVSPAAASIRRTSYGAWAPCPDCGADCSLTPRTAVIRRHRAAP